MVGGPEGSTAGMRFNPRESAEELQEDSSVGREDSEERARHDAKKREEQEKRAQMMQGLQHMKISVPQKHEDDEEDSDKKQQAELGQMTGQVGQSDAIDGANPQASGMGSNLMLSEDSLDDVFDVLRKKDDGPKYDDEKAKKTTTIETVRARDRARRGKKKRASKTQTVESLKRKRRRKGSGIPLKSGNVRQPASMSALAGARAAYMMSPGYTYRQRTAPVRLTTSSGRSQAKQSYPDPRQREAEAARQELRQLQPTQDITPPVPTMTVESRAPRAARGRGQKPPHKKALRQPRTAATPMGAETSEETALGGTGRAAAMAAGPMSEGALAKAKMPKVTLKVGTGMSARDKIEYRRLIEQLNFLMQRAMRKADASQDDPPTNSTPNGHPRQTSAPTGATETDPEDDPTMWGAHAYDLYVRRGGIS